ncbi:MAG: glyoxalase [Candidatus Marinimicrobia bacterium]|nr:glyoxalase [Candidatus Neomarinimicrobiota bacterium]|tara:strand:- start:11488 stop:11787 length:300 start_codon:yes stop_codon:yes gene_type:complete
MIKKLDKIDHIAIHVSDIQKSLNWYLENFKCEEIYSDHTWAFLKFENMKLALVTNNEHPPHFAIIDDLKKQKQTVKHRDGSESAYIKDIDFNYIELIKY